MGTNGSGKTTLLRILAGELKPDSGGVFYDPPDVRIGYLPQGLLPSLEETIGSYLGRQDGDLDTVLRQFEGVASQMAGGDSQPALQGQYDVLLAQINRLSQVANRRPAILAGLGLGDYPPETLVSNLSGGQKTRLALAGVLLSAPQLLLLDEPTNHLDLEILEWLEEWLATSPENGSRGILIVSHDRAFLDRVTTGILELDPLTHNTRYFGGNYTDYLDQKLAERERQWKAYSDYQDEINRMRAAIARVRSNANFRKGGKADTGDKFAKGFFANRSKGTLSRAKSMEKRLDHLMTDGKVEKPKQSWEMKLDFEGGQTGRDVLVVEGLAVGYSDLVLLENLDLNIRYGERIALVGPNGCGKSTLLKTINGEIPALAGKFRLGSKVQLGYMAQEQDDLDPEVDPFTALRKVAPLPETDARAFLHRFLFTGDDVFVPIKSLSFGERARLSLGCLVAKGCNFLILDEPINHLDIPSRGRFEQALETFEGTVLAVVHDRYFIQGFASQIWEVAGNGIRING